MTRPEFWQRWTAVIDGWLRRRRPLRINEAQLRRDLEAGAADAARTHSDCRLMRGANSDILVRSER